jgi:hypothetical protein
VGTTRVGDFEWDDNERSITMARNEFDMRNYDWSRAERGKYLSRANRSLGTLTVEKAVVDILGGPDKAADILRTIASALASKRKPKKAKAA